MVFENSREALEAVVIGDALLKENQTGTNQLSGIQVLLVERELLIRAGLTQLIECSESIANVMSCGCIDDALEILKSHEVDVICFDFHLGGIQNGLDLISLARRQGFAGAFVTIGTNLQKAEALHALRQGATAIVLTSDEPSVLLTAIIRARQGGFWIPDDYMRAVVASLAPNSKDSKTFSAREQAVLGCLFEGESNKEIASQLMISESAVKSTLQGLFRKTGTRSRGHLTRLVIDQYSGEL